MFESMNDSDSPFFKSESLYSFVIWYSIVMNWSVTDTKQPLD